MALGGSATAPRSPSACRTPSSPRSALQHWRLKVLLNLPNRRIRTRTYGGVGGAEPRGSPLSRFSARIDATVLSVEIFAIAANRSGAAPANSLKRKISSATIAASYAILSRDHTTRFSAYTAGGKALFGFTDVHSTIPAI